MALNNKEKQIVKMLKALRFDGEETIDNERENTVVVIVLLAKQYDKCDKVISIISDNSGKTFDDVTQLIFNSDIFPQLKIVDDDEPEES